MSWLTKGPNGPGGSSTPYAAGATAFSDDLLNAIAGDIRNWGGPVDAAGNNLSNLGVLTFHASGYLSGNIKIGAPALSDQALNVAGSIRMAGGRSVIYYDGDGGAGERGGFSILGAPASSSMIFTPTDNSGAFIDGTIKLGGFGNYNNNIVNLAVSGKIGNTPAHTSNLHVVGLANYADNAAAIAGGLTAGAFYIVTGSNPAQVAVVT